MQREHPSGIFAAIKVERWAIKSQPGNMCRCSGAPPDPPPTPPPHPHGSAQVRTASRHTPSHDSEREKGRRKREPKGFSSFCGAPPFSR